MFVVCSALYNDRIIFHQYNNYSYIFFYSLAALELSEWRKQHSTKKDHHHHKNNYKNGINNHLNENNNNDNDSKDINDDNNNNNEKLNSNLFKIASRQLESTYTLSLDIQERYGIN